MHILAIKKSVFFYLKITFSKKKLPLTGNVLRGLQIRPRLRASEESQNKKRSKMADLEAVLADVSYLMAMEKSKSSPAARASKKIVLPDAS